MDDISVEIMWESYLKSIKETPQNTLKSYESWKFESSEETSNYLVELVKQKNKTATSSTKDNFKVENEIIPTIGDLHIITNWKNIAQIC